MLVVTFIRRKLMKQFRGTLILASLCMLISIGVQAQTASQAPAKSPAKQPAAGAKKPAAAVKAPFDPALLQPSLLKTRAPAEFNVKFVTSAGEFSMKVTRAWAPNGADRFYNLILHHYFDGAAFFRVLQGFMAQFGLSAYPQVSRAWEPAVIKDDPVMAHNDRGYVTFAMAGPNSRTTQIFINYGNNQNLDRMGFAPFGQVTDGMDVVDKLYNAYGEGAPDGHGPSQELIGTQGRAYLEKNFSKLDTIKTASLLPATSAAPAPGVAPKPAASAAPKPAASGAPKPAATPKPPAVQ
jgi:peptidyl-prolyl cis-trans isomerase A (cyclophilin A)